MPGADGAGFRYAPDPANPGWMTWHSGGVARFNAVLEPIIVRAEGAGRARVRMWPTPDHGNVTRAVHGGAIMAFIDVAMFAGARAGGIVGAGSAITLDCSTQFIGPGMIGRPLDAVIEILRETGRLIFLRGLVEQEDVTVAAFSGTLRKATPRS